MPSGTVVVSILDEMTRSYLDYAMSVIVARALPDARDGLKPVHRRIPYSMHEQGTRQKEILKSARVTGEVIGKFHPHGDLSIYDALVRMAQPFSMRVPLVDGQGNFGRWMAKSGGLTVYRSPSGPVGIAVLTDIERTPSISSRTTTIRAEPKVLPAKFSDLLVNGGAELRRHGRRIPPHNPGEVIDACSRCSMTLRLARRSHPDCAGPGFSHRRPDRRTPGLRAS